MKPQTKTYKIKTANGTVFMLRESEIEEFRNYIINEEIERGAKHNVENYNLSDNFTLRSNLLSDMTDYIQKGLTYEVRKEGYDLEVKYGLENQYLYRREKKIDEDYYANMNEEDSNKFKRIFRNEMDMIETIAEDKLKKDYYTYLKVQLDIPL